MPPLRSLAVVLLLSASLAHSLPQDGPSRNADFTFPDKTWVLASRVSGRDLTRPRRQSSSRRLVDHLGGSGKLGHRDERDPNWPGTDSVRPRRKRAHCTGSQYCPNDNNPFTCQSGCTICSVQDCDGKPDCPDEDDEQHCGTCAPPQYTCQQGICAPRCEDCPDYATKENCATTTAPPPPTTTTPTTTTTTTTTTTSTTTTTTTPPECGAGQWQCRDGGCIDNQDRCDGYLQCWDGSDEDNCPPSCGAGQWQCEDGGCISNQDRCDGYLQCWDGSDEDNCPPKRCHHWEFKCEDGLCIHESLLCNGDRDCPDGSDERHCKPRVCSSNEWTCFSGQCVPLTAPCNNHYDCFDRSDEENCP